MLLLLLLLLLLSYTSCFASLTGKVYGCFRFSYVIIHSESAESLSIPGAMQTPEAGADSTSTVPLQTTVPVQPAGSTQQVPVQQQVYLSFDYVLVSQLSCLVNISQRFLVA